MPRHLLIVRLRSIRNPLFELIAPEIERRSDAGIVEARRSFGTLNEVKKVEVRRSLREAYLWRAPTMQHKIVHALCSGDKNRASCLLSELVSGSQDVKSEDFIDIFKYCAKKPDPLFAMETWNFMEEKEITLISTCYFLMIRALCKGGYMKEAFDIVSYLEGNSVVTPTLLVYNDLLQASLETHSLDYANACLNMMEQQAVGKSERTYSILLKLAVLQQDLSAVHEIWEECKKSYSPSIIMLRKFIWSFSMLKDLESAYHVLQIMVAEASKQNTPLTKTTEGKLHQDILDIPIPLHDTCENNSYISTRSPLEHYKEDDSHESRPIKFEMEAGEASTSELSLSKKPFSGPVMKFLRWSFNDLVHTCASTRNTTLAKHLIYQMQNIGLEPSSNTYDGYIRALVFGKSFRDGLEMLEVMKHKNWEPYVSTLAVLSVSCSRALELDLAENFLDQIPTRQNAYAYNAFFEACATLDQHERAVRVLNKMRRLNVQPDIRTYESLFKLFGNVNSPYEEGNMWSQVDATKRIKALEMDMMKHGIQHSRVSMNNMLKALGMEGMIKELIQYLQVAENQFDHISTYAFYETVLHSLVEAKETHMAIGIFRRMIQCGIPPNATIYNIMVDCCSVIKCYRSARSLVSLMIRGGFPLHLVTYTVLVKVLLEFENFDEAFELLAHARLEGIQPDVILYNIILHSANRKGRIDVIELITEQMHQEKIQPDTTTCEHVFSAYVDSGFDTTAMEALHVLSMRMISEEDDILQETRLKYENLILDEDVKSELQIIEVFKESPNIAMALLQLRWCAILEVPISWLPNQSPWAKRLSSDYASRQASFRI